MQTANKLTRKERHEDYEGFVEKFKPKKTTDDCYTPEPVYRAVLDWVSENILPLDGVEVVRPFYPGGDYENFDYPEGCVVIDNPPFSILAKIRRFFHSRGIRYFLFAPTLTMANTAKELDETFVIVGASVIYENGAKVNTSFLTNLDCGDTRIWVAGSLHVAVSEANKLVKSYMPKKQTSKIIYPGYVASPGLLHAISKRGINLKIPRFSCFSIGGKLDNYPKGLFGGGWLLSERAAAERAAAGRVLLSERELNIIKSLE